MKKMVIKSGIRRSDIRAFLWSIGAEYKEDKGWIFSTFLIDCDKRQEELINEMLRRVNGN